MQQRQHKQMCTLTHNHSLFIVYLMNVAVDPMWPYLCFSSIAMGKFSSEQQPDMLRYSRFRQLL